MMSDCLKADCQLNSLFMCGHGNHNNTSSFDNKICATFHFYTALPLSHPAKIFNLAIYKHINQSDQTISSPLHKLNNVTIAAYIIYFFIFTMFFSYGYHSSK